MVFSWEIEEKQGSGEIKSDLVFDSQIVEWINECTVATGEAAKLTNLSKIQEFLLHKEPHLLREYLQEVLQFSLDRNAEVRKFVTGFIEDTG